MASKDQSLVSLNINIDLPPYIRISSGSRLAEEAERQKNSIHGLNEYILSCEVTGAHTPIACSKNSKQFYMSCGHIYNLFYKIHLRDTTLPLHVNMLQEYDKIGYLILKSDYNLMYIYAEDFTRYEQALLNNFA